nr:hypothetical protein [Halomonas elongata]
MEEYRALVNDVTLWNVAVERPIRVKGPEAEAFCNYVCTRDVTRVPSMMGRYVVLCDEHGRVLNDPVMLRVAEDEFWFTISDSDLAYWFRGSIMACASTSRSTRSTSARFRFKDPSPRTCWPTWSAKRYAKCPITA